MKMKWMMNKNIILALAVMALAVMACGASVGNADFSANAANTPSAIVVKSVPTVESVSICGRWHVRDNAGSGYAALAVTEDRATAIVLDAAQSADGGLWLKVRVGNRVGWVNAQAVCE